MALAYQQDRGKKYFEEGGIGRSKPLYYTDTLLLCSDSFWRGKRYLLVKSGMAANLDIKISMRSKISEHFHCPIMSSTELNLTPAG
jgi:hypothetical protein